MTSANRAPSCLLLGYSGFANTGSEVRILTIIDDITACFGESTLITVATPTPEKTERILPKRPNVSAARFPLMFPLRIFRLVASHDITFLVEGSTFQQNWSSALLYFFLWGAFCARMLGKRCVAYAVDAGDLSRFNRLLTRFVCNRIDLLITRTERARQRLVSAGVRQPIIANTDTAFTFLLDDATRAAHADPVRKRVGIAPIEFHQWPVRIRPLGKKSECFRWPYYFTWTEERRRRSRAVVEAFAALVSECIDVHDLDVVLIAMEELDVPVCQRILERVPARLRPRICTAYSSEVRPHDMVPLLRGLDYLVTCRYHACVLSMAGGVPQMAVSHDDRLQSIYAELGVGGDFLVDYRDAALDSTLRSTFATLLRRAPDMRRALRHAHDTHYLPTCLRNRRDLSDWAAVGRFTRWARV
jgi:polysaccharide pyruvyl transferase WcaK-like protein